MKMGNGDPGRIRTCNLPLRRGLLYPVEPRDHTPRCLAGEGSVAQERSLGFVGHVGLGLWPVVVRMSCWESEKGGSEFGPPLPPLKSETALTVREHAGQFGCLLPNCRDTSGETSLYLANLLALTYTCCNAWTRAIYIVEWWKFKKHYRRLRSCRKVQEKHLPRDH